MTTSETGHDNDDVFPEIRVAGAVGATSLAAWSSLSAGPALAATTAVTAAAVAWLGVQFASPRTQWVVPTVFRLPAGTEHVALTFDGGPDPIITPQVLDVLAEFGAHATFFVVGRRAAAYPEVVRRVHAAGHQIGSHTFSHSHGFHFRCAKAMAADIERGITAIAAVIGERPTAFRPPVGLRVPTLRAALTRVAEPLVCYTWTERGLDTLRRPATAIVARLRPHLAPGAILTLHDGGGLGGSTNRAPTVAALRELLGILGERGLRSRRLDVTLPASPGSVSAPR